MLDLSITFPRLDFFRIVKKLAILYQIPYKNDVFYTRIYLLFLITPLISGCNLFILFGSGSCFLFCRIRFRFWILKLLIKPNFFLI